MSTHQLSIKVRDGKTYATTSYTLSDEPRRRSLFWELRGLPAEPELDGQSADIIDGIVFYRHPTFPGVTRRHSIGRDKEADLIEEERVQPPPARGKEIRWHSGRWEKLLRGGWVAA